MKQVIQQLKDARIKAERQIEAIDVALGVFAINNNGNSATPRKLSKAAREKIAAAQRRRWAKVRREKKG